jgi:glycosyltransferase involved in cell wall biosynthesis
MALAQAQRLFKLVVIIPALNEAKTVGDVIAHIPRMISGIRGIEIVVIDDGSTDDTGATAQAAGATVIHHPRTMGVGAAFHTGLRHALEAGADIIVNIDGDGQFNASDIPTLIEPILQQQAWFVTASRFADPKLTPDMPKMKRWGNRWMTYIINFVTGKRFTDVSCGFRAYTRDTALRLVLFGHFTYTQETFIDLAFKGIPMIEVPLKVHGERQYGHSRVASSLWRYGIKSASIIFRSARDYHPLSFFGMPAFLFFVLGVVGFIFLFLHWLNTGQTFPYRRLVTVAGISLIIGFMFGLVAMLADLLHRNRILLDKIIYLVRENSYQNKDHKKGGPQ